MKSNDTIRTIELFAGVGGFHLGLERANTDTHAQYKIVWSNQWKPSTKKQHASEVYRANFPTTVHSNGDIAKVIEEDFSQIPDHDLLVGGFPCQDYSVARTLNKSEGLAGKKVCYGGRSMISSRRKAIKHPPISCLRMWIGY